MKSEKVIQDILSVHCCDCGFVRRHKTGIEIQKNSNNFKRPFFTYCFKKLTYNTSNYIIILDLNCTCNSQNSLR